MAAHAHLAAAAAAASGQHPFGAAAGHPAAAAAAAMAAMAMHQNPMLAQHPAAAAGMFAHLSAMHPALRGHPMALMAAAALHQHQQQQQQHQRSLQTNTPNSLRPSSNPLTPVGLATGPGGGLVGGQHHQSANFNSIPFQQQQQQARPHLPLGSSSHQQAQSSSEQLLAINRGVQMANQVGAHEQQLSNFQQQLHQQLQLAAAAAAAQHQYNQQSHQQSIQSNQRQLNQSGRLSGSPNSCSRKSLVRPWET